MARKRHPWKGTRGLSDKSRRWLTGKHALDEAERGVRAVRFLVSERKLCICDAEREVIDRMLLADTLRRLECG